MTVGAFLPGIPYIHGGLELAETQPINTGFDFTEEERLALPPEALPLFSAAAYDWTREPTLTAALRALIKARQPYCELITDGAAECLRPLITDGAAIIAFMRGREGEPGLAVFCNSDMLAAQRGRVRLPAAQAMLEDILTGERFAVSGDLAELTLGPGRVAVCPLG